MTWISVADRLPKLHVPIVLWDGTAMFLGCRGDGEDGWIWCQCYDVPYYIREWHTDNSEWDDDHKDITHWHPLPTPPGP